MAEKDFVGRLSDALAEQVSADASRLKLAVPDYIAYLVQRHSLKTESDVSSHAV